MTECVKTGQSKGPVFDLGLCRCCGTLKKCRLLNAEYVSYGQKEVYSDLMMDCFGLLLSHLDGKLTERLVCATCVVRLREAYVFKAQVLKCEEAFIQMKMYESDKNAKQDTKELDLKLEQDDRVSDHELPMDHSADNYDSDNHSDEDVPLTSIAKKMAKGVKNKKLPSNRKIKIKQEKKIVLNKKMKTDVSDKPSMPTLQQINRERDLNYILECNLLTLIECSYICPFKCRHSNLLCYYCGKLCENGKKLREHNNCHDPKKLKIFDHKKTLKVDISIINCRLCDTQINTIEDLKNHLKIDHKKKIYNSEDLILPFKLNDLSCVLCSEKFLYFHALNKHMNVHFSNYVCETCGLGFVDKCRLAVHQQRHEDSLYPCEQCSKVFKAQYNKDLHVDRVHNKKGRVYCPKCDVMLMSYPQKLKHLVEVHGEEPLSFNCELCSKVCRTRRMLTIHRRKDHLNDFRYECQFCGQRFFTRFSLNNHTPTHTGERNFKCKVCEKSYPRLKTLKDHMRIHTNDRRYRCAICGQAFIQNCSLKGHMKSQHPEYG